MAKRPRPTVFDRARDICIIGLPGAGKTTLMNGIVEHMATHHVAAISAGDVARSISTESARTGAWAPAEAFREAMYNKIAHARDQLLVIEGFPRTVEQMVWGEKFLNDVLYVMLDVPAITCVRRLFGRGRTDDGWENVARKLGEQTPELQAVLACLESPVEGYKADDSGEPLVHVTTTPSVEYLIHIARWRI